MTQTSATLSCKAQKDDADHRNPWVARHNKMMQTSATLSCKTQSNFADQRNPELQNATTTLSGKTQCNCDMRDSVWQVHCPEQFLKLKAFRYSFARSTHRIMREGSSSQIKTRISPQCRAFKHLKMRVYYSYARENAWNTPAMRAADEHTCMKHANKDKNHHFTTVLSERPTSTKWREGRFGGHVTTFLNVRQARSDEKVVSHRGLPNLPCVKKEE